MILRELFSSPKPTEVEFTVDYDGDGKTNYWFEIGEGTEARWYALTFYTIGMSKNMQIIFEACLSRETYHHKSREKNMWYMGNSIGHGDMKTSLEVWSTVIAAVKDFISKVRPLAIRFGSMTDSHDKMYTTGIMKMKPEFEAMGYVVEIGYGFWIKKKFS